MGTSSGVDDGRLVIVLNVHDIGMTFFDKSVYPLSVDDASVGVIPRILSYDETYDLGDEGDASPVDSS